MRKFLRILAWILFWPVLLPIWLFRKIFSSGGGKSVHWKGSGIYTVDVVGESQFQDVLEAICGKRSPEGENRFVTASLVINEDEIEAQINNRTIGFLREQVTPHFSKKLKQAGYPKIKITCDANIRGGWVRADGSTGHYGVWLDLPT